MPETIDSESNPSGEKGTEINECERTNEFERVRHCARHCAGQALRESEERYRILAEELREADRHKNEFLATLSHELRNPLAAIRNSLAILEHALPGGDQAQRAIDMIDRQVGQLSHLVDDLLDITRITQNKLQLQSQWVELNALVRQTLEDYRTLFEKNEVLLEADYFPSALYLNADGARLAQVIGNLVQNAAKFTGRGGKARVSLHVDAILKQVVIRIADTGIGMTPEMLSCLFQPFIQADTSLDRSRGGLGLGLALVKGLVEMQGGKVSASSEGLGKGTEIVVRLPLTEMVTEETQTGAETISNRRRVLIIDDNIDLAESLRELLEITGHEIAVSYNGPEGLIKAREFQPEIILCDIGLPVMDGYEVARAIRADETLKEIVLVALTGYALPRDRQRATEAGFEQHLAKPVDYAALERILTQPEKGSK